MEGSIFKKGFRFNLIDRGFMTFIAPVMDVEGIYAAYGYAIPAKLTRKEWLLCRISTWHDPIPERALLAAIVYRAYKDLSGRGDSQTGGPCSDDARAARQWFLSNAVGGKNGWTFLDICSELDLNPAYIRNELISRGLLPLAGFRLIRATREISSN